MKKYFLILGIALLGCENYENIVIVCSNYPALDSKCATGFFVSKRDVLTAEHVRSYFSEDVLTIPGPGINKRTLNYRQIGELDVLWIRFKESLTDDEPFEICPNLQIGTKVEAIGLLDWRDGPQIIEGVLLEEKNGLLYMSNQVRRRFSGGPIIDVERDCVIGVIHSYLEDENITIGTDITKINLPID